MRSAILMFAALLAACAEETRADVIAKVPTAAVPREKATSTAPVSTMKSAQTRETASHTETMPGDACTREGYWSFFETFVRMPALRPEHSDDAGRAALPAFDIAQQDSRWVRATDHTVALDIQEHRAEARFEVRATPVELDADDEVVRTLGDTKRYRFDYRDGCWRFAGML